MLVASAQNELGTPVARTSMIEDGISKSESMSSLDSPLSLSAGAARAMPAKSRAARDLYCILVVGIVFEV